MRSTASRLSLPLCFVVTLGALVGCDDGSGDPSDATATASDGGPTGADTEPTDDASPSDTSGGDAFVSDPTTLAECTDGFGHELPVEFLELASADGSLAVRLARFIGDGTAVGETFPLELGAFGIERDGELTCVRDPTAMGYTYGHHNWDELAEVDLGDGTTARLELVYTFTDSDVTWVDTLELTGASPVGPTALEAVSCRTEPAGDLNFCLLRPRTDQ